MPLKETLPPDVEPRLAGLGEVIARASPDVDFAYLFGSAAGGRLTPRSDIDVAIHVGSGTDGQSARLDVARALSAHLGTDAVDVVLLNAAPVSIAGRILVGRRVLLDCAPFVRHRYESRIARLFHDFRIREHRLLARRYARG